MSITKDVMLSTTIVRLHLQFSINYRCLAFFFTFVFYPRESIENIDIYYVKL